MFLIGILVAVIGVFIGWRFLSQRHKIPCPSWLSWMVELDNPFAKENRAAVIIDHLKIEKGMNGADVGCGPGRLTIPLAHAVGPNGNILAMDVQEKMLKKVQSKATSFEHITYLHAELGQFKSKSSHYDFVVLVTVLGEIPQQKQAFAELYAMLKPQGILSVTEIIFDPHFQSLKHVSRLAKEAGFIKKEHFGPWYSYTVHFEKTEKKNP